MGELQTEFMRDAEATSSQIQVMSSRLIAMSQENTSLKERMREDSDTASDEPRVQIEFGDVSELEPVQGPGPGQWPVTVTVEPESRRDLSAYSAAVARIREGRGLATATKPVVVDTSYLVISSSSSPSKRMSDRMMKLDRKTDSSSKLDEKEGEVDIGVYQNVNRASLIIEAIRTAGVEGTAPGSGTQQPSSSSVCIDRSSLLHAVTALCDEMYEIQQKVGNCATHLMICLSCARTQRQLTKQ